MTDFTRWLKTTMFKQLQLAIDDTIDQIVSDAYIQSAQSKLSCNFYQAVDQDYIKFYVQKTTDRLQEETIHLAQKEHTMHVDSRKCQSLAIPRELITAQGLCSQRSLLDIAKQQELSKIFKPFTYPFKLVFLDIETDGLDPRVANILQISLIEISTMDNSYHSLCMTDICTTHVKPYIGYEIDTNHPSTAVHQIPQSCIDNAPMFRDIAAEIADSLVHKTLVGFNIHNFDIPILTQHLKRTGKHPSWTHSIDLAQAYWKHFPSTLQQALRTFKITSKGTHDAQKDALACIELFAKLVHQQALPHNPDKLVELLHNPELNETRHGKQIFMETINPYHPWLDDHMDMDDDNIMPVGSKRKCEAPLSIDKPKRVRM